MPLRSSRKNTRNRVRVFENRSPYDQVMVRQSFQKIQVQKQVLISKIRAGRLGGKNSRQAPQVDSPVDLGIVAGIFPPGPIGPIFQIQV